MSESYKQNRRGFLRTAIGAGAAPLFIPAHALGRGATAPSDRVTVGIIGSGQRAVFETRQYPSFDNTVIVAVSDAQESRRMGAKAELERQYALQRPGKANRGIRMCADFHDLLAQKDIDAVYIASPDHWHVSMLIPALAAGKHVHCEKPLGVSVDQDLAAWYAARKYSKQVFQYGAESRSNLEMRKGIELVVNGRIGKVQKIFVVAPPSAVGGSATPVIAVPDGFNYDHWLGPAPLKPFCADRCLTDDPRGIFNIADYSLGQIGNWAAHPLDQVQRWADATGRTEPPLAYSGAGKFPADGLFDTAYQWNVRCTYRDGLEMHFMDCNTYAALAERPHPDVTWGRPGHGADKMENGAVFMGSEGWLIVSYGRVVAEKPALLTSEIGANEVHLHDGALTAIPESMPRGQQQIMTACHHQNWIEAIRTGSPVADDIESAFRSDMVSQLSDLCIRTGQSLRWDPKHETIVGNAAARKMIKKPMRAPWGVA